MKRYPLLILALLLTTPLFAQNLQAPSRGGDQAPGIQESMPERPPVPPTPSNVTGILAFVGDQPVITVEGKNLVLAMPDFYYYAYSDGFKAGMAVTARGLVLAAPEGTKDGDVQGVFIPKELTVNGKTYVIVGAAQPGPSPREGTPGPKARPEGR